MDELVFATVITLTYIITNCGSNQVIIAENEIPEHVDYSAANMIEFTLEEG